MENNKKPKIIEMRYPAPYSQSWANPDLQTKQETSHMKKSTSQGIRTKKQSRDENQCNSCWSRSKPYYGSDPFAPHLKYGLFPRKMIRPESSPIKKNYQSSRKKQDEDVKKNKEEKQTTNKSEKKTPILQDIHIKKKPFRKGQHSENAPERTIDKKQPLSTSEMTHVDIKPVSKPLPKIVSRAVSPKRYAKRKLL